MACASGFFWSNKLSAAFSAADFAWVSAAFNSGELGASVAIAAMLLANSLCSAAALSVLAASRSFFSLVARISFCFSIAAAILFSISLLVPSIDFCSR
ncbi:MAG: hypothetical protein DWH98_02005 [Planctomycetota bacterium]|nr:MAG: hypothetical protein DWH98_02005 [Planctomycetota bacterium]